MFPLNLDLDASLHREGRWQLRAVNRRKDVPTNLLLRPAVDVGEELGDDDIHMIDLEPEQDEIIELTPSGLMVVHWVVARPDFFSEVCRKHLPKDRWVAGPVYMTRDLQLVLAPAKAREFRFE